MKDDIQIIQRHQEFIKTICQTEKIYTLEKEELYSLSYTNNYQDEEGNPIQLLCVWSQKKYAQTCQNDEWTNYQIEEIDLVDFIENWCIGLDSNAMVAGIEFDQNLYGYEADPLELILEIIDYLKIIKKDLKLSHYKNLNDLSQKIKEVLD
ncbi:MULTISPECIES: DUF2750 domain-containing protein [Flavobacterium]|uniref:DUF2750 domain-containing protein n=1 Tax=Flavobacterium TaxID=237 RepID=UPI000745C18A|nr:MULTISPECIES: DUF2750 domain-containing protein [Flavobacterium]OXA79296.1 hypothetical protein B0A56_07905 [Flavobacterium columnare NBRC 100251 = ATCC 23463]AMA49084.1 hypothetical protein AWN65_06235 [Flavobacterium covae]AND64841.1 hypothetical protein AX766_10780 [Flavobacterium covae]MCJ1807000.1 DUF2750 domain-containing protein [Flavobacterium covae]MCJ1809968.1 DUF2750 domain-containing protein [Flavobacterium covae]